MGLELNITSFLILAMATYRISNMMADVYQTGPWDMLSKIRHMIGVRFDTTNQAHGETMVARGLLCVMCNSVWFGFFWAMLYLLIPDVAIVAALPFALSGLAILVEMR